MGINNTAYCHWIYSNTAFQLIQNSMNSLDKSPISRQNIFTISKNHSK